MKTNKNKTRIVLNSNEINQCGSTEAWGQGGGWNVYFDRVVRKRLSEEVTYELRANDRLSHGERSRLSELHTQRPRGLNEHLACPGSTENVSSVGVQ